MYASCRCGTGRSFDVKIIKFGWYILWPCKMGSSKMVHVGPVEGPFCGTVTF